MGENVNVTNPMAEKVLNGINSDVLNSLSSEQLTEIKRSLSKNLPERKKHSLDVHGIFPLLSKRRYFVFSSGLDNRKEENYVPAPEMRVKTEPKDLAIFLVSFICISVFFGSIIYKIIEASW